MFNFLYVAEPYHQNKSHVSVIHHLSIIHFLFLFSMHLYDRVLGQGWRFFLLRKTSRGWLHFRIYTVLSKITISTKTYVNKTHNTGACYGNRMNPRQCGCLLASESYPLTILLTLSGGKTSWVLLLTETFLTCSPNPVLCWNDRKASQNWRRWDNCTTML